MKIRFPLLILLTFLCSSFAEAVDLKVLWTQSQNSFAAGDYSGAEASLIQIIANTTVPLKTSNDVVVEPAKPNHQWMEPVFYMLAASYFNGKDYENAVEVLKRYLQLFPHSQRIYQVNFSQAQAEYFLKDYTLSESLFKALTSVPIYHDKSVYGLIQIYLTTKNDTSLISLLEGETVGKPITPFVGSISVILGEAYLRTSNPSGAQKIMFTLDDNIDSVEDVTKFNALAIHLGDGYMHDSKIDDALNCYRRVRNNDDLITLQTNHIAYLQFKKKQNLAAIVANPLTSVYLQLDNKDLDAEIDKEQKLLATYQTLPPILPRILVRTANAYAASQKYWEASVVYSRISESYSDTPEAETALYGLLVCLDKLKRIVPASKTCEEYLARYPQGKYLDSVTFIQGILAYDAQDYDKAATFFLNALTNQPNNPAKKRWN